MNPNDSRAAQETEASRVIRLQAVIDEVAAILGDNVFVGPGGDLIARVQRATALLASAKTPVQPTRPGVL